MNTLSSFEHTIYTFCATHNLIKPHETIIVGLSGGPDSVCLLHLLKKLQPLYNITLIAAHLNHGWRNDADTDELFCKHYAESLGIPFISTHARTLICPKKYNGSLEEQGRTLRRLFFDTCRSSYSHAKIALGHHKNDQTETFLLRLIRGASITGLCGIRPQEKQYIRPLLPVDKKEILTYLHENALPYVTDSTNESCTFLRNALRHKALPVLHECDPRFETSLHKTVASLHETEDFLEKHTQELYKQQIIHNTLTISKFILLHPALQKRLLILWLIQNNIAFTPSAGLLHEIIRFLHNTTSNTHTLGRNWCITKKNNAAIITLLKHN